MIRNGATVSFTRINGEVVVGLVGEKVTKRGHIYEGLLPVHTVKEDGTRKTYHRALESLTIIAE